MWMVEWDSPQGGRTAEVLSPALFTRAEALAWPGEIEPGAAAVTVELV